MIGLLAAFFLVERACQMGLPAAEIVIDMAPCVSGGAWSSMSTAVRDAMLATHSQVIAGRYAHAIDFTEREN